LKEISLNSCQSDLTLVSGWGVRFSCSLCHWFDIRLLFVGTPDFSATAVDIPPVPSLWVPQLSLVKLWCWDFSVSIVALSVVHWIPSSVCWYFC
jgi:hypothetical protein